MWKNGLFFKGKSNDIFLIVSQIRVKTWYRCELKMPRAIDGP